MEPALVASGAQLPGLSPELGSARLPQAWVRSGELTSGDCGWGGTHKGAALEPGFVTATSGQQGSRRLSSHAPEGQTDVPKDTQ